MTTPYDIAIAYIEHAIEFGHGLDSQLNHWQAQVHPDRGEGQVWINVAGGYLYIHLGGSERVKVKAHQIGVAIYQKDVPGVHEIFDLRELWKEVVNPKPKQLELWGMV